LISELSFDERGQRVRRHFAAALRDAKTQLIRHPRILLRAIRGYFRFFPTGRRHCCLPYGKKMLLPTLRGGLNGLRKNSGIRDNWAKNIPPRLKPGLILLILCGG
jgi:hypothetical protein